MDEETVGIMLTNPNTLGLFEESIREITAIVHGKGGLVYGDGANMNAVMGLVDSSVAALISCILICIKHSQHPMVAEGLVQGLSVWLRSWNRFCLCRVL